MLRLLLRALPLLAVAALLGASGCTAVSEADDGATSNDALTALPPGAYDAYAALATEGGLTPAKGSVTVLGIRGLSTTGEQHDTKFGHAFDDTLVILAADGVTATRFPMSTHPFELEGVSGVPDVDGDGVADVGIIEPGVYDVNGRTRLIAGAPSFTVSQNGNGRLPGWRDVNHDGVISDSERAASVMRKDGLTDILFHQGEGSTAPAAVGCQVLPASAIRPFATAIGGATAHVHYVLVDVSARDVSDLPSP